MASRLLRDKGVFEYVEAAKIIKNKGLNVEFRLYGDIDEDNPASLNDTEIKVIKFFVNNFIFFKSFFDYN